MKQQANPERRQPLNTRKRLVLIILICGVVILAILIAGLTIPESAYANDFASKKQAPSLQHPFGTDVVGRDMLFRSLKGLSTSLKIGLFASSVSAVAALFLGMAAALFGKRVDGVITWMVDLCMSLPHMVLLIMLCLLFGKGALGVTMSVALTHWPNITRIIRAEVKQLTTRQFVKSSMKLGQSRWRIAIFHIVPHVFPQFIVGLVLLFPHAIMHEASVTFLGFGLSMDSPAIGVILSESMKYLTVGMWWLALLPGLLLITIVLLFQVLGRNVEKLLNPATGQL